MCFHPHMFQGGFLCEKFLHVTLSLPVQYVICNTLLVSFRFSHHCSQCEFDVCHNCFKPHDTPLHPHPLYRADSHFVYEQFSGGWRCDNCGSVHNNPIDNKPWHCQTCEYDLCHSCMSGTIEGKIQCSGRLVSILFGSVCN